jgi:hypothetical protein
MHRRIVGRLVSGGVLVALSIGVLPSLAAPPAGAAGETVTFNGTCQLDGTATVSGSTGTFVGDGLCTGNFLGIQPHTTQPALFKIVESGLFTPAVGATPRLPVLTSGRGAIYLWNGVNAFDPCPFITFTMQQAGPVVVLRASTSGEAVGVVSPGPGATTNVSLVTLGTLVSPFMLDCPGS